MKIIFNIIFAAGMMGCCLSACKKDEIKTVAEDGVPPALTASASTLVLDSAKAADSVELFKWSVSNYGFKAVVKYTVQIAKSGSNFDSPKEISMGTTATQLKFTTADLNQIALLRGLVPGSAGKLDVRIKSSLSDSLSIYSNTVTITVTPYLVIINYPSLLVPGGWQGWSANTASKISSKANNGAYEGYVNITGSPLTFKYTTDVNWTTTYGWASSTISGNNVTGTFAAGATGNLFVPVAGYYYLKGNTGDNSWSATKVDTWSMIGDFNSWGGDVDMTYSSSAGVWTGTLTVNTATVFKFRANHDWPINFGDTGADMVLDYNGSNIAVTAGTHTITLDLRVPWNYTYKIQ